MAVNTTITLESSNGNNLYIATSNITNAPVSIAVDYSSQLNRIATAAERVANSISNIALAVSNTGVRVIGPFDFLNIIFNYKSLVENGVILNSTFTDTANAANALIALEKYYSNASNAFANTTYYKFPGT
jgi:hypothetical protein